MKDQNVTHYLLLGGKGQLPQNNATYVRLMSGKFHRKHERECRKSNENTGFLRVD